MKKYFGVLIAIALLVLTCPIASWSTTYSGPHLWLSTDPSEMDEGGDGWVDDVGDPWLNQSYLTPDNPFDLYIYSAKKDAVPAEDITLLLTILETEIGIGGTISVTDPLTSTTTTYSVFDGVDLTTTGYSTAGGPNHGVYEPPEAHLGRFAIASLGFDLSAQEMRSVEIAYTEFSQIHIDVFSSNGFYNPPSHDATGVIPEPGTIMLLGSGLMGVAAYRRKRFKK